MRAIYIGRDGLNGFTHGKQYEIQTRRQPNRVYVFSDVGNVMYLSEKSFARNWQIV